MRRAALLITVLVLAGSLAAVSAAAARRPSAAGREAGAAVYIAAKGCAGHAIKPTRVVFACADGNVYATGLRYSSYASREAKATGVIHANECTPNCASGHFRASSGTVRFYRVVSCADGRRYFTRTHYRTSKGAYSADIEPFGCASA